MIHPQHVHIVRDNQVARGARHLGFRDTLNQAWVGLDCVCQSGEGWGNRSPGVAGQRSSPLSFAP